MSEKLFEMTYLRKNAGIECLVSIDRLLRPLHWVGSQPRCSST